MKNSEKGQGLIEYALILILVCIVVIVVLGLGWLLLGVLLWPWLSGVVFPWFAGVVAGVMVGDPTSIASAIVLAAVFIYILFRVLSRRSRLNS